MLESDVFPRIIRRAGCRIRVSDLRAAL